MKSSETYCRIVNQAETCLSTKHVCHTKYDVWVLIVAWLGSLSCTYGIFLRKTSEVETRKDEEFICRLQTGSIIRHQKNQKLHISTPLYRKTSKVKCTIETSYIDFRIENVIKFDYRIGEDYRVESVYIAEYIQTLE